MASLTPKFREIVTKWWLCDQVDSEDENGRRLDLYSLIMSGQPFAPKEKMAAYINNIVAAENQEMAFKKLNFYFSPTIFPTEKIMALMFAHQDPGQVIPAPSALQNALTFMQPGMDISSTPDLKASGSITGNNIQASSSTSGSNPATTSIPHKRSADPSSEGVESNGPNQKKRSEKELKDTTSLSVSDLAANTPLENIDDNELPSSIAMKTASNVFYEPQNGGSGTRMFVYLPKSRPDRSPFHRQEIVDNLDPNMSRHDKLMCQLLLMSLITGQERRWSNSWLGKEIRKHKNYEEGATVNGYVLELTRAAIAANIGGINENTYLQFFPCIKNFYFKDKLPTVQGRNKCVVNVQYTYPVGPKTPPKGSDGYQYYHDVIQTYNSGKTNQNEGLVFNEALDDASYFKKDISRRQWESLETENDKEQFRKQLGSFMNQIRCINNDPSTLNDPSTQQVATGHASLGANQHFKLGDNILQGKVLEVAFGGRSLSCVFMPDMTANDLERDPDQPLYLISTSAFKFLEVSRACDAKVNNSEV